MSDSNVTVLLSTVNSKKNIIKNANIKTDAIIINQSDAFGKEIILYKDHIIYWYDFDERGVGLSRNNAISRVKSDYAMIVDDDVVLFDDYESKIKKWFDILPNADVLIFNIESSNVLFKTTTRVKRINKLNFYNYGATRIVFKTKVISMKGIYFNQNFGGGTTFSCGEDTLFLNELLNKKLKVYAVPDSIYKLTEERESTWFKGYNEKYFFDNGVFWATCSLKYSRILSTLMLIKNFHHFNTQLTFFQALKLVHKGIKFVKSKEYLKK